VLFSFFPSSTIKSDRFYLTIFERIIVFHSGIKNIGRWEGAVEMGYLLPVHYTQYQEYQNRIKPLKTNDLRTVRVDRVKPIYLSERNKLAVHHTKNKGNGNMAEKVYADMTGIGGNFDEKA
jgi:hypothetical protein